MSGGFFAVCFSRRRQTLLEIGDDVVLVLEPDRQAYDVGPSTGLDLLRVRELAVRGRGWVNDQRTGVADIGEVREQFHIGDQSHARVIAALESESEAGACALGRVFLCEIVVA